MMIKPNSVSDSNSNDTFCRWEVDDRIELSRDGFEAEHFKMTMMKQNSVPTLT